MVLYVALIIALLTAMVPNPVPPAKAEPSDSDASSEDKADAVLDMAADLGKKVTATVPTDMDVEIESVSGKVRLYVPMGAVDEEVDVEMTELGRWGPRDGGMLNVLDLRAYAKEEGEDEGTRREITQFNKGLTISIQHTPEELRGLDLDTLKLCYLDEDTRKWVPVLGDTYDRETNILTATIDHFSRVGENIDPIITGPGRVMAFQTDLHSGAAVYSYPIEVPPGSGGFQPSIQLVYNSASVDEMKNERSVGSWVGIGWSLSLGSISWDPQTDYYFLDLGGGSYRLIPDIEEWHYYTVPETFYKITRCGQQWNVYDREGIYYKFGGTPDSEQYYDTSTYYRWDLSYMQDTNSGNAITITYVQEKWSDNAHVRSAYPEHVTYNNGHVDINFISSSDGVLPELGWFRSDNPVEPVPKVTETRHLDSIEKL